MLKDKENSLIPIERFPNEFMFQLTKEETDSINRSQFATSSKKSDTQKHRNPRFPPRAFTQEGVAMLSSVLRSERAIQVNIAIIRTFIRMRHLLANNEELAHKVAEHDKHIANLYSHVERLLSPSKNKKNKIGFIWTEEQ
jgi:phage regulator Rha-like protein